MLLSLPRQRTLAAALLAVALLAGPAASTAVAAPAKRLITEMDLFKFVWIADPRISPDGKQIVFVRVTINEKKEGYDTALWIVGTDGSEPARPFTSGPRDSAPRWSPDGSRLAFVRSPEKEGKPQPPQIHVISLRGGEAVAVTDLPDGAGGPVWSPNGKTIAFVSSTNDKDLAKRAKKDAKKEDKKEAEKKADKPAEDEEERESDVRVITRALYRFNGGGYLDYTRPGHIWTVPVPAPGAKPAEAKQITKGEFDEGLPVWSQDGSTLYFTSDRVKESYYLPGDNDLYSVPAQGGEIRRVLSIDGGIGDFAFSPDGRRIAFAGFANVQPERSYSQSDLFVANAAPGSAARNLTTGYDYDIQEGLVGDQHPPRGNRPSPVVWSRDGRSVVINVGERGRVNLMRFDAETGATQPLTRGDQEVVSYTATLDGSKFAVVISTPTVITDLHVLDAATGDLKSLVRPNEELFKELNLTEPEEITYKSFDGREIPAFVQKPPGFERGKKYPLILNIHGGPHGAFGYVFFHEIQWMAAKGYVVIYPNPRGSTTYGQEFGNVIQYAYPGDDAKDLLAGVDELVRRGWADPKRLGVTGGSGGGLLTNWIITQTDRFAAAASQRSIADWTSFWYTADFTLFTPFWFRGAPWEHAEDFVQRSPITHVDKVKTPLMLIEGEDDYRTPPAAGGEMMFRALKYLKKPVVMVRFPGETHDLSRTGKPWHRIERLRHIVGWFDKYLQGKQTDAYDVP